MADDDDPEGIAAQLHIAEAKVTAAKARRQRWTAKYETATRAIDRGQAHQNLQKACEATADAEREVRRLTKRLAEINEVDEMKDEAPATSLIPPGKDWVLVVNKAGGLRFGDKMFHNGEPIDPALLADALNGDRMLSSGYVKWRSKAAMERAPKPVPTPVSAVPFKPRDLVEECRQALREAAQKRGTTMRNCCDVIPSDVLLRAVTEIKERRRVVKTGSWGSGNPIGQQTGAGTNRRIVDDVLDILCADEKEDAA
jgi:hypothetical protein